MENVTLQLWAKMQFLHKAYSTSSFHVAYLAQSTLDQNELGWERLGLTTKSPYFSLHIDLEENHEAEQSTADHQGLVMKQCHQLDKEFPNKINK